MSTSPKKGLGLHNDLQNESSIVGNFPQVLMFRDFGTPEQQDIFINGMLAGTHRVAFGLTEPTMARMRHGWKRAPSRASATAWTAG